MLVTTRALTPRIGSSRAASGVLKTGTGLTIGSAGVGDCKERSRTSFCDAEVCAAGAEVCAAGADAAGACVTVGVAAGAGACVTGAAGATGAGVAAALGVGGTPPRGAPAIGALVVPAEFPAELFEGLYVLKNSIQEGSSEVGSIK